MAVVATPEARERVERLERIWAERRGLLGWLTTCDHKRIGILYLFTSLAFFAAGGVEALLIRTQLLAPNNGVLSPDAFNQAMTMHGVTMIFLFVIPISMGAFGNYLLPLMLGARDMAFPRLNALSYWLFLGSGLLLYAGVFTGNAPDAGWFNYVPLASKTYSPGPGIDFYALGLIFNTISTTAAAANFIVTIFRMRAPGMSLNRMPLFAFAFLAVSFAVVFALPALTVDLVFLELDRRLGFSFFDVARGGDTLLWQHLFWIFGHPEVYIIILPAFGIATSIIPAFTKRRMVAFPLVALAEILVAFIGFGVWVHHMFSAGLATIATIYFAAASLIIVVPSAIQLFAWLTTLVTGRPIFRTPLLYIVGFIVFFIIGGLSGIAFAAIPFDQQLTDTYFVVAHFHFVIFGAAVFPILGGLHYWFPKVTGRMYHERVGQLSFWLTFLGTALTFFPMHILGLEGMPRRTYTYHSDLGWTGINLAETIGAYLLAAGLVLIVANLVSSFFRGARAPDDPWDGATLEWATTSPPPAYNFPVIPRVTSPYPMWDARDRERDVANLNRGERVLGDGHETPTSTVLDADWDEILDMPATSPWPVAVAAATTAGFAMLLIGHWVAACVLAGLAAVALAAWHGREPLAAAVAERRRSLPNGVWGAILLIATEATLFGTLIASYFYLEFNTPQWPPAGIDPPGVTVPLLLTALVVATSGPLLLASRAARAGRARAAWALVLVALVVQAGYLGGQLHLFAADLHRFSPGDTAYGSIYFTLLGAHHFHVVVGLALEAWLLSRLARGLTAYRVTAVRAVSWYWHFVNLMALFVVGTQLSPSA